MDFLIESPAVQKALDLLRRSPSTYWTANAAATALDMSVESAYEALERLERAGLLERARATEAFRYAATDNQ